MVEMPGDLMKEWKWQGAPGVFCNVGDCGEIAPVCKSSWVLPPLGGDCTNAECRSSPVLITDLRNKFMASDIILKRLDFMAYAWLGAGATALTTLSWYTLTGGISQKQGEVMTDYRGDWSKENALINLTLVAGGLPLFDAFYLSTFHTQTAGVGGSVLAFGNPTPIYEVTTAADVGEILVTVYGPTGYPEPNTPVRITGPMNTSGITDLSGQYRTTLLYGDYEISASKMIEGQWYDASGSFNVPNNPTADLYMEARSWLPWWWYIPIIAGGGLIGLWLITRMLKRPAPPTPPVYIMR